MLYDILGKLSEKDFETIIKAMDFMLNGNYYYPEELHPRVGLDPEELISLFDCLQRIQKNQINMTELSRYSGLSEDKIMLGIHNVLGDVGFGGRYTYSEIKPFGVTRQKVKKVFNKWDELEG